MVKSAEISTEYPNIPVGVISPAMEAFLRERTRQVVDLGYNDATDAGREDDLVRAGACYVDFAVGQLEDMEGDQPHPFWPWGVEDWKPSDSPWRTIEKGVALIAAGYDAMMHEEMNNG